MRKIPTVFKRDPEDMRHVLPEVTPGCEWVLAGEGVPTRKYDGTCVALLDVGGRFEWYARREVKPGKDWPPNFMLEQHDPATGKDVGWVPIEQSDFVKWWREAYRPDAEEYPVGTYELVGPKINGNPEQVPEHRLMRHADAEILRVRSLDHQIAFCKDMGYEGVVWHHPDGRMAKLKVRDFS